MKRKNYRTWVKGYYKNIIIDGKKMRKWISGHWKRINYFQEMKKWLKENEKK